MYVCMYGCFVNAQKSKSESKYAKRMNYPVPNWDFLKEPDTRDALTRKPHPDMFDRHKTALQQVRHLEVSFVMMMHTRAYTV